MNWLMLAGLLFASLSISRAQVLSSNVVGYVNVAMVRGYNFIENTLDAGDNSLTNILELPPDGTRVYVWDVTNQVFLPPAVYNVAQPGWSTNYNLPPGRGFVVNVPSAWTNTFTGDVLQGNLTNFIAGHNRLSLVGSMVPVSGQLTAGLEFPGVDGASVSFFDSTNQMFKDACLYFTGYGWFDPQGVAGSGGPLCEVGSVFFVRNPGPDTNWARYFTVNIVSRTVTQAATATVTPAVTAPAAAATGVMPSQIHIHKGVVRLNPLLQDQQAYDVQFSTDGLSWITVSTNHQGGVWTRVVPNNARGFYRLVEANHNRGSK